MSGHSWSFLNVSARASLSPAWHWGLCSFWTLPKWLDPWLSSQCEQNGGGEEPGWFGTLKEAPPWRSLGALTGRAIPGTASPHAPPLQVSPASQAEPSARRRPSFLYLAVRSSWVGPPYPSGMVHGDVPGVHAVLTCVGTKLVCRSICP